MTVTEGMLRRRGFALEYPTLAWNVAGTGVLISAAAAAGSVAVLASALLNAVGSWCWAYPLSALFIVLYGLREARHAWTEAARA